MSALLALIVASALVIHAAPSSAIAAECSNEAFRTGPSALLPDCRAYEQASPNDKNGGGLEGAIGQVKAAADGSGVTFFSQAGIPGGLGAAEYPTFMASRSESSWSTQGLLPPPFYGDQAKIRGFSSNLRYVAVEAIKSGTGPGTNETAFLLEDTVTKSIRIIVPYTEAHGENRFILVSVSNSGNQVYFESKLSLESGIPNEQQNLFMWSAADGSVSAVGVLPADEGGERAPEGSFAGPYRWWENKLAQGGAYDNFYVAEVHATSEDGNEAFFTTRNSGQLYLRRGLTGAAPSTVRISAPQRPVLGPDPLGPKPAVFLMATQSGSNAIFMSHEKLTDDAQTGPEDEGFDLYSYDTSSGALEDLTPFAPAAAETPNGAEVQGVLGMSADASVIYFVANGALAPGATPGTCNYEVTGGMCNLYRLAKGAGGLTLTFITQFEGTSTAKRLNGEARNWSQNSIRTGSQAVMLEPTSRVSQNGEALLFRSFRSLTGYDNSGCDEFTIEVGSEGRCPEFFRYSAATGNIVCVSCDPTGAPPVGPASLRSRVIDVLVGGFVTNTLATQTRNLSSDGTQIFFETPDSLVSGDVNGEGGCRFHELSTPSENNCQDVYEWEAEGSSPSCAVATTEGGCLFLVSTGQSSNWSNIADIDQSGKNVYFFTESQLVPTDGDHLVDVYDARVGGGIPGQHPAPTVECTGEECQRNATPAVTAPPIGSAEFVGPANPTRRHKAKQKKKTRKCKRRPTHCGARSSANRHRNSSSRASRGGAR